MYRFDDPLGEYGVLYAGEDEHCAFIETYGHPLDHSLVTAQELRSREVCQIEFTRGVRLVDLTRPGLARLSDAVRVRELGSLMEPHHRVLLASILDTYGHGYRDR
jgi:hypothetical protein